MSKRLSKGDRVIFQHANPDMHDTNDGAEAEIVRIVADGLSFDETAYVVKFHGGQEGLAFRSELRLAEVVLVE